MPNTPTSRKHTDKDWNEARKAFATSLMVDTKLTSLAQSLELGDWPIRGAGETPSKYIDFTWEELNELPGLADKPERIDFLIHILKETIAFDEPFGDMVSTVDAATAKEDGLLRNLKLLEIPTDYPIRYSGLSRDTREFCEAEDIKTVGEFTRFSQNMAQNIIVGGDFRELLNAITTRDEIGIARFLPFRPYSRGLHLPEAVGIIIQELSESEKIGLLKRYGAKLDSAQAARSFLNKDQLNRLEAILVDHIREKVRYFDQEIAELEKKMTRGITLQRYFMVLDDPEKELIAANAFALYLKERQSSGLLPASEQESSSRGGFFSRLFGRRR